MVDVIMQSVAGKEQQTKLNGGGKEATNPHMIIAGTCHRNGTSRCHLHESASAKCVVGYVDYFAMSAGEQGLHREPNQTTRNSADPRHKFHRKVQRSEGVYSL